VDLDAVQLPPIVERRRAAPEAEKYLPHRFEKPEQVPAIADFGGDRIVRYTTSTHDQAAWLTTHPQVIEEMLEHYAAKIERAIEDITLVKQDFEEGADILFISYGIASRSVAVAVKQARAAGRKVSSLVLQTLWPVPERVIQSAMRGIERVVVPEMNLGQYLREIERLAPDAVEVRGVCKMNTQLITPEEILTRGGVA
jgi:2-oxoglutarate ferredoxin oxidoreductase subunit alpha